MRLGEGDVDDEEPSATWVGRIDRGGLFRINQDMFSFFVSLEGKFRQLQGGVSHCDEEQSKDDFRKLVVESEKIQRQWDGLSQNIEDETEAMRLLDEIVAMWIAMRGFSKTSAWLEQYKKDKKKTVKKSKGLRKSLQQ